MARYLDAIATNYDVDSPDGWIGHYYFDALRHLTGNKPILISEWYFSAKENRSGNLNNGYLMTVRSQDERARGAASAARYFARIPNMVGIHWFQYYDEPRGGRPLDGENYDFGLVDTGGQPYPQLVLALGAVNRSLGDVHRDSSTSVPPEDPNDIEIPEAVEDADEADPAQWFKDAALVKGLKASAPDAVFGDFFLAWTAQGLHLATVSMDYYDPAMVADAEQSRLQDAFRITSEWTPVRVRIDSRCSCIPRGMQREPRISRCESKYVRGAADDASACLPPSRRTCAATTPESEKKSCCRGRR